MKKYVIDRIEGEYAICVDNNSEVMDVRLSELDFEAKEGMCILFDDITGVFSVDVVLTEKMNQKNKNRLKDLFGR